VKISASAVELVFEDDFWDSRDSILIKGLSLRIILFAQKMSSSVIELGFLDDYLGSRVLFFINDF
jgi:hypothetical protein